MNRFGFVTNGLSHGNDPDAVLGKLAQIEFLLEGLAKETAIAVDNNEIEGMLTITGAFDHLLEARPPIIAGRGTSFDVLRDHVMPIRAAPRLQLASLIRNGKVVLSLPTSRYAHVEGCAQYRLRHPMDEIRGPTISDHGFGACIHCIPSSQLRRLRPRAAHRCYCYSTSHLAISLAALCFSNPICSKDSSKSAAKYVSIILSSPESTAMSS